jgi:hypothetical protein
MKEDLSVNNLKRSIYAPVRRRLFRDLFLLILSIFLVLLLFIYLFSEQMKKELAISVLDTTAAQIKSNFETSFNPVQKSFTVSKKWLETNNIKTSDIEKLNQRFIPLLETTAHVSSVIIANSNGEHYLLLADENQWLVRTTIKANQDSSKLKVKWSRLNDKGETLHTWQETINYKIDNRPWYKELKNSHEKFIITKPYLFFTQKVLGISLSSFYLSKQAINKNNPIKNIIAFDITINNISETLDELKVGENGKAFLLSDDGSVLLPKNGIDIYQGNKSASLINLSNKKNQHIMFDAIQNWKKKRSINSKNQALKFSTNGYRWWSQFFYLGSYGKSLQAGIIVPEHDYIHVLEKKRAIFIPIILILSLVSILAAWLVVRSNSKRQKEMPKTSFVTSDFKNELYDLLRRGESETLELKSTMRKNLRSGKNGKEIELAWLKGIVGFLNTNGGILLIGVDDNCQILGLDADEFENDDKIQLHFKNLISQHIGLEFSKYIKLFLEVIDKKTIAVVECKKSDQPVFLYHKNDEIFYIRSGPATVSLSISKALKYIQGHKF